MIFNEAMDVRGEADDALANTMGARAAALGLVLLAGKIQLASTGQHGQYGVSFAPYGGYNGAKSFGSDWPEWAYQSASAALLHGRRVWVLSDGRPIGPNLREVMIAAEPA